MTYLQPTRTRADRPDIWVGDDGAFAAYRDGISEYPADIYFSDVNNESVGALHLSPSALRKLRDACTGLLTEIESATIEAAGLAPEPVPA
jgi:hypothetical protein